VGCAARCLHAPAWRVHCSVRQTDRCVGSGAAGSVAHGVWLLCLWACSVLLFGLPGRQSLDGGAADETGLSWSGFGWQVWAADWVGGVRQFS